MQGDRLKQAETIFAAVVNAPLEERETLLAERCGGDAELRAFVEQLLRHHDSGGGGDLDPPAGASDSGGDANTPSAAAAAETVVALGSAGRALGPYVLRERLGTGGMGEVWRAEQTSPIRRTVALKLIKAGMDSEQVIARFEAERQALSLMDHPAIAKVLDAGTTPEGRPYFVMEHVPGIPINQYCDNRRLETRRRLELFEQVCEAVQHAHQKAVIHRDLKPTNILVTDVDGQPLPKIIDFGVAKATVHRLTERTMHTMLGQMIGTPEYMSPEQADFTAEDVDTRTDVYSLGVVLYELLVGALPFETAELRNAGLEGILRMLREKDPPRPSTRLSTLRDRTPEIARHRRTEPRRLAGQLKGDLDWIVMRALEKDRSRRYGSARELAQDVRRHLDDEPVLAGPPTALYRTGKFVRRHRIAVASGVIAVVALIGVTVTMGVLRGQAEQARAEAQARATQLEAMTEFQASMLSGIDPAAMGLTLRDDLRRRVRESLAGEGATSDAVQSALAAVDDMLRRANPTDMAVDLLEIEVLDRAANAVARDFADQPLVRAALRQTLADVYAEIGRHDRALPLQEAALETRRRVLGDDHEDTLYSLIAWGWLGFSTGDLDGARDSFQEALERSRRVLGEDHLRTLEAIHAMGRYCGRTGDEEGRLLYQRQAMEGCRRAYGNEDPQTLDAIQSVGYSLMSGGRLDEALPYFREAWEGRRRVLGDDHPSTLMSMGHVGYALAGLGGARKPCRISARRSRA